MKRGNFFLSVLAIIFITGCSEKKKYDATIPVEITSSESPFTQLQGPTLVANQTVPHNEPEWTASGLDKKHVCMVNNTYMGKNQYPVKLGRKLYYGCCGMCVTTIQKNANVRIAKDPISGQEVDKSEAFITIEPHNQNGGVLYFESEANYKKFVNI